MKRLALTFSGIFLALILVSCGNEDAEKQKAEEAAAAKADSIANALENSRKEIEAKQAELDSALKDLNAE